MNTDLFEIDPVAIKSAATLLANRLIAVAKPRTPEQTLRITFQGAVDEITRNLKFNLSWRGAGGPELTVGIYDDIYRIGNPRCHTNGGDKGSCLKFAADADSVGLAIDTRVTNIDIVNARGKAAAGANAHCRVIAAGGVVQERLITVGRVADPLSWFSESGFIGVYPWP